MLRAFLKDSAIYALPALISRGLSLFLIPLYTRVLSPADYGSLDLLTVFASIVNLTIALEVSQGLARYYAGEQAHDRKVAYASSAFWFTLVCYSIFAVLALLFTRQLATLIMGQAGMETAFRLGVAFILFNGLFYLIQNQFRWELRSQDYAMVSLLMSLVTAGASVWFAYGVRWGLEGLLLGMIIGSFAGTIFGLWRLRNSFRFQFDAGCLREMLVFSTPLVFSGVAVWASLYIDRIMINHLLSVDDVGLYGVGYRVASIAGLIMVGFQGALAPLVYTHYREQNMPRQLATIFRLFILLAMLLFLVLTLFATDILKFLVTERFYGGTVVVVFLVPAIFLANMYIFAPGIGIAKKTDLMIWINVGGALLNIGLNYILIPTMGIIGAGLATLLGSFGVFVAYMVMSQKLYPVPHQWGPIMAAAALAAVLGWAGPQLESDDFVRWGVNGSLIGIYVVACFILGLIRVDELREGAMLMRGKLWPYRS